MLIVVAAEKGGVGKTTIATNLAGTRAARGHSVMLVDTDVEERTGRYAYSWGQRRREDYPDVPDVSLSMLRGDVSRDLWNHRANYDTLIVDVPAGNGEEMRVSCLVADVIVIPVRIGQYDTDSLSTMVKLVRDVRTLRPDTPPRVLALLNAVPPSMKLGLEDSRNMLDGLGEYMSRTRSHIVERGAFLTSAKTGLAVPELPRKWADKKAEAEVMSLYEEVFND